MNLTTYLLDEEAHLLAFDALVLDQRTHLARDLTDIELSHWGFAHTPAWQDGYRLHLDVIHTERVLPSEVIRLKTAERIVEIERMRRAENGEADSRVGKREAKAIKQAVTEKLIAEAPQRRTTIEVALDPTMGMVLIGTAKASEAEAVVNLLRRELGSFPALPMGAQAAITPSIHLTDALRVAGYLPEVFLVGDRVTLAVVGGKAKARFTAVPLLDNEVFECIRKGYRVERMGLVTEDGSTFEIDKELVLRRFELGDVDKDALDDEMDRWGERAMRVIRFGAAAKVLKDLAVWMEVEQPLARQQEAA